ncbi:MAG: 50S ribosomal protein L25/general stress protein Ctc [Pseudomonadales bacterium]
MSQPFEIKAELRKDVGKGASRRLRRAADRVPGIIYGGGREPQTLTVNANALNKALERETFYSQIISVVVDGDAQQAVLRDLQRHPASEKVQHIDFLRVSADQEIDVNIPLHFINEDKCVGVKQGGGTISHSANEVEVRCLPKDLPEFIEVDVSELQVGHSIHISELKLPEGVVAVDLIHGDEDHDSAVVSVLAPRGGSDEEGEEAAGEAGDAAEGESEADRD